MTAPIIPGAPMALQQYLRAVDDRLAALETPKGPTPVWPVLKAALPAPASYINCMVFITDLDILAHSDGVHWIREDTGAPV